MHTIHLIAVQLDPEDGDPTVTADNLGECYERASYKALYAINEQNLADWSDWNSQDAGRWANQYRIVNALHDKDLWNQYITDFKEFRANTIRDYAQRVKESALNIKDRLDLAEHYIARMNGKPLQPFDKVKDIHRGLDMYYLERYEHVLQDRYNPDSNFYDIVTWTPGFQDLDERVKIYPEGQFLVPIDFHH